MSITSLKKIHIIGIEGAGTSALARLLKRKGVEVSGSDEGDHFYFPVLEEDKVKVYHKFDTKNVSSDTDLFIFSTAHPAERNIETAAAIKTGKKVIPYAEAIADVFNDQYGIAVCGSHGKTTTSAWLAYVMNAAGKSPSAIIGSLVPQFNGGALVGYSDYFVLEADEYQNKLQYYRPRGVLLNNIDYDHPDFYKSEVDYRDAFLEFIKKIPRNGFLVANYDDPQIRKIAPQAGGRVLSYAINTEADYIAYDIRYAAGKQIFRVKLGANNFSDEVDLLNSELGEFSISLVGRHSISNALAVIVASLEVGLDLVDVRTHLEEFTGTAKRMESMGRYRGVELINDYAHHPTEVRATLDGAHQMFGNKKILTVFQPHTFTRTKALLNEFASAFDQTNELILIDIYGSAREEQGGVHSLDLVKLINERIDSSTDIKLKKARHIASKEKCLNYLREHITDFDVIIFMGAGEAFRIGEEMLR